MFKKAKYFNNYRTACSLMIDDFVPVAVTYDGQVLPNNDWGYGKLNKNSLFDYLNSTLFLKYPEIKGTFFVPFESQFYLPKDSGMKYRVGQFDTSYLDFFNHYKDQFDIAFHGIKHTYYSDDSIHGNPIFEFHELGLRDYQMLRDKIAHFEALFDNRFTGGKFPGYFRKNKESFELLVKLGFKWWAFSLADNKIAQNNFDTIHVGKNDTLIDMPSNLNGNVFNHEITYSQEGSILRNVRNIKRIKRQVDLVKYIAYLYKNRLPITIQEHAQNQSLNGKRQRPNLYDDINSLDKIFGLLRGKDIWYVSCGELAQYYDAYSNTKLIETEDSLELIYEGSWEPYPVSIYSDTCSKLLLNGQEILGLIKDGKYVFNNLLPNNYKKY